MSSLIAVVIFFDSDSGASAEMTTLTAVARMLILILLLRVVWLCTSGSELLAGFVRVFVILCALIY